MTHPAVRHVADMATDIAWLARNLPTRLDTLAARTPDGWPTGRRSGGGQTSRPTETAALAGLNPRSEHARITALAAEAPRDRLLHPLAMDGPTSEGDPRP